MIRVRLAHSGPLPGWAKSDWFYNPKLARGGAMLDMAIHAIDQALWHLGPVRSVQAVVKTLRKKIKVDDNAVLLLEFARTRALGYVEAGWTSPAGFNGIEIMGDHGCILEDYAGAGTLTVTTGKITPDLRVKTRLVTKVVDRNANKGAWGIEIAEVVKAFRRNSDLGCSIDAGGAALRVALAGYESSRTGRRVTIASTE
jgi:predicted dehydrogenase